MLPGRGYSSILAVTPDDILAFWFGPNGPEGPISDEFRARWWRKDPAFDDEIRRRFGDLHARACKGELDDWCATPRGCLALVIVIDQFSRNLHRDDPRAWENDDIAQRHCLDALDVGKDAPLPPDGRAFLYMPLMHAEDRELQAMCVDKFAQLAAEDPRHAFAAKYADRHKEIVDRFGRFPHRNEVLGRETTPEEAEFLKEPNSRF
jgi:uncharacterized protein (DUF924 family)